MNKISAKSVQTFVAGALSLSGFHYLFWTPYYVVVSQSIALAVGFMLSGLMLWIGIAMLTGSERAIFWARVYLLLSIVSEVLFVCFSVFQLLPKPLHLSWWRTTSDLLTSIILLWLLVWSRSERFHQTPPNNQTGGKLPAPVSQD
jgi:Na+-driven multidrug efflux pump